MYVCVCSPAGQKGEIMATLETKAKQLGEIIHGKYDQKHRCVFHCIVSPSGKLCQVQAKRGGNTITKQTIPWSRLEGVADDKIAELGKAILASIGQLLEFAAI